MRREFTGIDSDSLRSYARARAALLVKTRPLRQKDAPPLDDWRGLLAHVFSAYIRPPYAPYHVEFWNWVMSITADNTPRPFVTIWPRRAGKSTNSEVAAAVLGALRKRRFVLFVSATQDQANDHVQNIAALLESDDFAKSFPATARRKVSKYGHSKAWRQNRLRTADGFIVHAIGLDTAARGVKIEGERPDCIIFDDLDELHDTPLTTEKKIETLTKSILPTGGDNPAVIFAQNLIIANGIAGRLVDGRADFMVNRYVSGPHPAVENLTYEIVESDNPIEAPTAVITGGESTWSARSIADIQAEINRVGITAFLAEFQHEVQNLSKSMYAKVIFHRIDAEMVPPLFDVQCWIDPAVSDTKLSDSQGIQIDGITGSGHIYRLYSWEERTSPQTAMRRGILQAKKFGASVIGVETDQGGDTWESVYELEWRELVTEGLIPPHEQRLQFAQAKAGGHGSKMARSALMLAAYERGEITHVRGTHDVLERALRRFGIEKPFDLADAAYWSWDGLANDMGSGGGAIDYTESQQQSRSFDAWDRSE